ncbi:Lrp/AsnC family transcriptional regulator [Novosphingobium sediminicola]|uniref:Lrp/AsnC family leucine-responsive transcriptional regulator n=1 Tax=Novosphingobium sediminicola TaxID=563162 RepID=A0A7W6G524_9SPHN|nr:Lrp/AsnC family transcriptional regulator [Novosphingobium sediminicola]MBB3953846.1 Lrp/AsnC family leucine-responsive transcriptional regulator [Novosphingobium sediminicola]
MNKFDRAILRALERDARQSFADLAEEVGMSKTPCWNRVQGLEASGAILGYRAMVEPEAVGLTLDAFVQVSVSFADHAAFEAAACEHPSVIACYTTAGDADYLLHVMARDVAHLDGLLRGQLRRMPGVERFNTTIGMKRIKRAGAVMAAVE